MIEAEGGDDGHLGMDDVGGVQPPPQAHLQHGDVHPLLGQVEEPQGGGDLEGGDPLDLIHQGPEPLHQGHHLVFADQAIVDADPLAVGVKVRGGVKRGAVAGGPQDGGDHGCRGAFSLGAGDVDGGIAAMGVAQEGQYPLHAPQVEAGRGVAVGHLLFVVNEAVDVVEGLLIGSHLVALIVYPT